MFLISYFFSLQLEICSSRVSLILSFAYGNSQLYQFREYRFCRSRSITDGDADSRSNRICGISNGVNVWHARQAIRVDDYVSCIVKVDLLTEYLRVRLDADTYKYDICLDPRSALRISMPDLNAFDAIVPSNFRDLRIKNKVNIS